MPNHPGLLTRSGSAALLAALLAGCAAPKPLTSTPADSPEAKQMEAEKARFRSKKEALIDKAMELNPDERDAFWKEYRQYETEWQQLNDQRYQIIRDYAAYYGRMTDAVADNLAERVLRMRQARNDLARKYYRRIKKATSAITAARFLQVEDEINLLSDLKLSSEAPLFPKG